jgi:hypothetical protein
MIAMPQGDRFIYPRIRREVTNVTASSPIGMACTPIIETEYRYDRQVYTLHIRVDTLEEVGNEHSKDFMEEMRQDLMANRGLSPAEWAQRLLMWMRILERGGLRDENKHESTRR